MPVLVFWAVLTLPAQTGPITSQMLTAFQRQVALNPNNPDARLDLAMAYCRTVWVEACYFELVQIHRLDPSFVDKTIKRYSEAVRRNPYDIEAHFRLSFAYFFKDQKSPKAIEEQQRILELDPKYVWAYNYLAFLAYIVENDLAKALRLASTAVDLEPTNAIAHFLLGQGYYKAGRLKEAAAEMALSARLRTTYPM